MPTKKFSFARGEAKRIEFEYQKDLQSAIVRIDGGKIFDFSGSSQCSYGAEISLSNGSRIAARLANRFPEVWFNGIRIPGTHASAHTKLGSFGGMFIVLGFLPFLASLLIVQSESSSIAGWGLAILISSIVLIVAGGLAYAGQLLVTKIVYIAATAPYAYFIISGLLTGEITRSAKAVGILVLIGAGFMVLPKKAEIEGEAALKGMMGEDILEPVGEAQSIPAHYE